MLKTRHSQDSLDDYMKAVGKLAIPTAEERTRLIARAQTGDLAARNEIIVTTIPWIIQVARRRFGIDMPLPDLVQEGVLGLIRAIELFDPSMGFAFLTYATGWIKQRISRAFDECGQTIRVPLHIKTAMRRRARVTAALSEILGHPPSHGDVDDVYDGGVRLDYVIHGFRSSVHPISIDTFGTEHDRQSGATLLDIADPKAADPNDDVDERTAVLAALRVLTSRERDVIISRFGLFETRAKTLEEVGAFSIPRVSRERIRQIEAAALLKLRYALTGLDYETHKPKERSHHAQSERKRET